MTGIDATGWADFCALFEDDQEAISEIAGIFIEESRELETRIVTGMDAGEAEGIFRAAHSLKSTSRQLGAHALADLAHRLEALGKAGDVTAAAAMKEAFVEECAAVRAGLDLALKV